MDRLPRPGPARSDRRGAVLVTLAIALATLLGISALVLDLGHLRSVQEELQSAADASAHAGAGMLDGTESGLVAARQAAVDFGAFNEAGGAPVTLDPTGDVELGVWDETAATFTPGGTAETVNAVRAIAAREDVPAWFAAATVGADVLSASADSIAVRFTGGASQVECYLPLAVPSCVIEDLYGVDGVNMVDLVLNPPGVDNVGWAMPGGSPNADDTRSQIRDCEYGGSVDIGDPIGLGNGVIDAALKELEDAVESSTTTWQEDLWGTLPPQEDCSGINAAKYGNTYESAILVFEDDSYCAGGGSFNGTEEITGFVWAAVYEVCSKGAAAEKTIKLRLETREVHMGGSDVAGPDYSYWGFRVALVE